MNISDFIRKYVSLDSIPDITKTDIAEIIILSFVIYQLMVWIKKTRTWMLVRGLAVMGVFVFVAFVFRMNTILWIFKNVFSIGVTALVIVFHPELRKAMEQLGRQNLLSSVFSFDSTKDRQVVFSPLGEYERTGISLDSLLSSQLLINIFEHNTPLHDGAVLIRGNRILSATCYLPLSDNLLLSKELGTRHRAAVGISEVTDSFTIVVSEETGFVSVALEGELYRNVSPAELEERLKILQEKSQDSRKFKLWKGRGKSGRKTDE